jgi:outer membrane protein assembly factor BamB
VLALRGGGGSIDVRGPSADRVKNLWHHDINGDRVDELAANEDAVFYISGTGSLYALDAATGNQLWTSTGNLGRLFVSENGVYAADGEHLRSLDPTNGGTRWSKAGGASDIVGDDARVVTSIEGFDSTNGKALVVTARDPADGKTRWSIALPDTGVQYAGVGEGLALSSRIVVALYQTTVFGLSPDSGEQLWKFKLSGNAGGAPRLIGDTLVIGGSNVNQYLYGLDATTGKQIWRAPISVFLSDGLAADDDRVYVGGQHTTAPGGSTADQGVYAYDMKTGKRLWRTTGASSGSETAGPVGDVVYAVSSVDDGLWALDRTTGKTLWSATPGGTWALALNSSKLFLLAGGDKDNKNQTLHGLSVRY